MNNFITYNGVKFFYRKYGEKFPVIILLHGFAEDGEIWNEQIEFLKDHFTILVPDLPGSGNSAKDFEVIFDDDPMIEKRAINKNLSTIEFYADGIREILADEKIDSCIMLGHSMGGYITLAFAEKYQKFLRAFGFIHSTAFADSEEKIQSRKKGIETMEKYGAYAFVKSTTPNLFSPDFKANFPERIEALIEKGKAFGIKTLQQYYAAMMNRKDRTFILREAKYPVLFIAGNEDVAVPLKDSLRQVSLPSVSYIHIIKSGHMGMWENAALVNTAILNFMNDIAAA